MSNGKEMEQELETLKKKVQVLEDKLAIQDVLTRYGFPGKDLPRFRHPDDRAVGSTASCGRRRVAARRRPIAARL